MSCLSLCKWNVRVTEGLCASEAVGPRQSQRREWGAGVLHRLNRLGATAACLWEWRRAFWANGGMSLRAEEWVRGASVGTSLCSLCWVELKRDEFYSGFFGTRTHKHTHTKRSWLILFSGEVKRFDAIIPWVSEHRLAPFTVYGCVFVFVFVCQ